MASVDPAAIEHQVRLRLDILRQRSYAELAGLPTWASEIVPFGELESELITYRKGEVGNDLVIAVQCFPPGARRGVFWIGVYADGFHVTPSGVVRPMVDQERYGYM